MIFELDFLQATQALKIKLKIKFKIQFRKIQISKSKYR